MKYEIGLISDTHGLMREEALRSLSGVHLIIHAGDIGTPEVIGALRSIAPVKAIRGNNDRGRWADAYPETKRIRVNGIKIYVLHNLKEIALDPVRMGFKVVISGHSHKPSVLRREGVLFVNPGSAGPRRFRLPVAVGRLSLRDARVDAKIIELVPGAGSKSRLA